MCIDNKRTGVLSAFSFWNVQTLRDMHSQQTVVLYKQCQITDHTEGFYGRKSTMVQSDYEEFIKYIRIKGETGKHFPEKSVWFM